MADFDAFIRLQNEDNILESHWTIRNTNYSLSDVKSDIAYQCDDQLHTRCDIFIVWYTNMDHNVNNDSTTLILSTVAMQLSIEKKKILRRHVLKLQSIIHSE